MYIDAFTLLDANGGTINFRDGVGSFQIEGIQGVMKRAYHYFVDETCFEDYISIFAENKKKALKKEKQRIEAERKKQEQLILQQEQAEQEEIARWRKKRNGNLIILIASIVLFLIGVFSDDLVWLGIIAPLVGFAALVRLMDTLVMDPMVTTITEDSRKPNYPDYEHAFNYELLKDFEEGRLDDFDMETMRGLIYGYTFTEDYAKGIIPDAFSMDYWVSKRVGLFDNYPQEQLLFDAISSTGEGLSQEDAICVICVKQEYEYLKREWPLKIKRQKLLLDKNIDCVEFEEGQMIDKLYFDINRWFERVKYRKYKPFGIFED